MDSTTVFVTGEFGRTPKINARGGRDHYPRAMCGIMAGGGIRGGQVVGGSDARGEVPAHDPYSPDDVAATFYKTLGIDITKEYHTPNGRPVMIVRNGKAIEELVYAYSLRFAAMHPSRSHDSAWGMHVLQLPDVRSIR